jgi:hypothetical protein
MTQLPRCRQAAAALPICLLTVACTGTPPSSGRPTAAPKEVVPAAAPVSPVVEPAKTTAPPKTKDAAPKKADAEKKKDQFTPGEREIG